MTQKDYYDFREDENTRNVSLLHLILCALKRWKIILLAGIVLGGLLGSYKILSIHSKKDEMIKAYDSYVSGTQAYKEISESYKKQIAKYQASVDKRTAFAENSIKMQIDPYSVAESTADIIVTDLGDTPATPDELLSINYAVYNEIYYSDLFNELANKVNIDKAYLSELIAMPIPMSTRTIRVTVRCPEESMAENILDNLIEVLEADEKILDEIGDHNLNIIKKGTTTMVDFDIQTQQDTVRDSVTRLQTSLYTAQNQNAQLIKPVSVPKYSKKYMLFNGIVLGAVGFAAGALLALAAIMILIILKGAIFSPDEIDGEFGLRTFADLSNKKSDWDAAANYTLARLENLFAGKDNAVIGVVGSASDKDMELLTSKLNDKAGKGLKFKKISDFMKDANAYRSIGDTDGVILTAEIGKTDFLLARKEVALIAESGKELLGTVYF